MTFKETIKSKVFVISVVTNIIITIGLLSAGVFYYKNKIEKTDGILYVIDVDKLYEDKKMQLTTIIEQGATEEEIIKTQQEFVDYVKKSDEYLSALSAKNNIVIYNKKAVFGKTKLVDITQEVIDGISQNYKQ